jgi:hypothetical protein
LCGHVAEKLCAGAHIRTEMRAATARSPMACVRLIGGPMVAEPWAPWEKDDLRGSAAASYARGIGLASCFVLSKGLSEPVP